MLNRVNLASTLQQGYQFIVGEKLKALPKSVQEPLLNLDSYQKEWLMKESAQEQIRIRYRTIEYEGRTIIATY
ncbi:MAG: hypothetical protein AAF804_05115, partial [Bacteroidota bacterium]